MAGYNLTRFVEVITLILFLYFGLIVLKDLLERNKTRPPSFTIHLYPDFWTLNNGNKFLYNNQIAVRLVFYLGFTPSHNLYQSLLDDIRAHRIPVDFLDLFLAANVPFYDGLSPIVPRVSSST